MDTLNYFLKIIFHLCAYALINNLNSNKAKLYAKMNENNICLDLISVACIFFESIANYKLKELSRAI